MFVLKSFLFFHYFIILIIIIISVRPEVSPCKPSPCGPNSKCREVNQQSVCSCIEGYVGNPPSCRPECTVNSDCKTDEACNNQKCRNPCIGGCGINAQCKVYNHNPICICPSKHTGDPFVRCYPIRKYFFTTLNFLFLRKIVSK